MADARRVVIVGGGLAGAKTAEELRDRGFDGSITIVAAEEHVPYDRPPLSKAYLQGKDGLDKVLLHDREWYAERYVDLRLGTCATTVDRSKQSVSLDSGDTLPYDALVLATGSRPRPLEVEGAGLENVQMLRTLDDSDALRAVLAAASRIAIVGGGWIGLEAAAAARAAGLEVTVLEASTVPLGRVLGDEMAEVFADLHRANGVDLRTHVEVASLVGDEGRVVGVELNDGSAIAAEAVLVGIGVAPDVDLAQAAGLDVDNGVLVDAQLRSSDPRIFAVGDIANAWHPVLDRRIRVEHWANALNQPAVAADAILGGSAAYDRLPYFYTDQYDLGMEYVGYAQPGDYDRVVTRGDVEARTFLAFWTSGGRVLAGMNVNIWDVTDDIRAVISSDRAIDLEALADPLVPLTSLA